MLGHRPSLAQPAQGASVPGREGGSWSCSPTGRVAAEVQALQPEAQAPAAPQRAALSGPNHRRGSPLTSSPALGSAPKDLSWHLLPLCHLLPGPRLQVLAGAGVGWGGRDGGEQVSGLQREQSWEPAESRWPSTAELDLGQPGSRPPPDRSGWCPSPASSRDRQTDGDSAAQEQQPSLPAPAQHPLVWVTPAGQGHRSPSPWEFPGGGTLKIPAGSKLLTPPSSRHPGPA